MRPEIRSHIADLRLTLALRRFWQALDRLSHKYRPDQPRAPKGTSEGGQWIPSAGAVTGQSGASQRVRVAQNFSINPIITPERMFHIINSHGFYTPRTRPNNSRFLLQFSTPEAIQSIVDDLYRRHTVPMPWTHGNLYEFSGDFVEVDLTTGAVTPLLVGVDKYGQLTDRVRIRFDPVTGQIHQLYPVEMWGAD